MIILIRLVSGSTAPEWMAQALLVLFRVIGDGKIEDEDKILPTDLIGRLARIPSGLRGTPRISFDALDYVLFQVLDYINIQV